MIGENTDMADMILLISGIVGSLAIVAIVLIVAFQARGSRPVVVRLCMANTEKSAKMVDLKPYVELVSKRFPETLDT